MSDPHVIEARIRYRTTEEGGRQSGVRSGYRGQFYYDREDFDGFQHFPDVDPSTWIELGEEVRAFVEFFGPRWEDIHQSRVHVGMAFQIREGHRVVGDGVVTRTDVPYAEWGSVIVR